MLTYFSATAREDFWTEHRGGHTERLLAVARTSRLARPSGGRGLYTEPALRLGHMLLVVARRS